MLTEDIGIILDRDLLKLKEEISAYKAEANLWKTEGVISNSAGNLCLHLVGNLNHFIGAVLGGTDYVRNRDKEFSDKNVPRDEMLSMIDELRQTIRASLAKVKEEDMDKLFGGQRIMDKDLSTSFFLCHLTAHLSYHLGQINYHRRLLDS